ncbi:MAG: toll/interleukin-1 receptor domain-containing protein, partial [Saprospiraceae bacterium]
MNDKAPQVFLSYAHESDDFRQTVWELAEYLRGQGIHVVTDHPFENRAPQNGWRAWMQHCVEDNDLVLVICTPRYRASFEKRDPDLPAGFGRTWEAAIITQELYETKLQNAKYIPVLPDGGAHDDVPVVLRDFSNGLRFPSQQERIFRAIAEEVQDPNANLSTFRRRPTGQLSADDNRLAPDQRDVYGRDQEIARVLEFLHGAEAAAQVVAQLTGTGGIGKTEICKRSLQLWLRQNPGARAYWVGLSDTAGPGECAADIARALGHDNLPEIDQLFSLLRPGLYYIDNLESLDSPGGHDLLRRLGSTPGVRVLASSRVRLAALGKPIEVDTLPLEAAMRTFREAWTGGDELFDSPDFPVFVERDLGCHALSLVLVAALGEAKSLNRIMADWRAKGTAIARQEHDPSRRGSLAVSLHLTSDAVDTRHSGALLLWAVAALFPDGLDESVLAGLYQAVPEVDDDALLLLVRHRVLIRRGERYHLLPPVARFALDEAQRNAGGFSWAATKAAILPLLDGLVRLADSIASTNEALQARAVLLEKFPTVHRFLLEECQQEQPDTELLAFFQNGLRNWFQFSILLGKDMLETLQPVLAQSAQTQGSNAAALQALGDLERRLGNVERARSLYDEAIGLFKKEQDDLGRANALKALGDLESRLGNVERARSLYDEAIGLFKKEQSDLGRANALKALGDLERRLGNVERARSLYDEAIGLFKKEQSDLGRANALQ